MIGLWGSQFIPVPFGGVPVAMENNTIFNKSFENLFTAVSYPFLILGPRLSTNSMALCQSPYNFISIGRLPIEGIDKCGIF